MRKLFEKIKKLSPTMQRNDYNNIVKNYMNFLNKSVFLLALSNIILIFVVPNQMIDNLSR